jgi:hypothetical protein
MAAVIEPASDGAIEPVAHPNAVLSYDCLEDPDMADLPHNIGQAVVELLRALAADDGTFPRLAFGVGCLYFGANPETFDGIAANHEDAIRTWLESEPSVSNATVWSPEVGWAQSGLDLGLEEGGQAFPAIYSLEIAFDLLVDPEVQERWLRGAASTEPIELRVVIRLDAIVPIAFVRQVNGPPLNGPSTGVTLAWQTLRKLVPPDGPIIFDLRGPSPAHVDCYLIPLAVDATRPVTRAFEFQQTKPGLGYAVAVFGYDKRAFADMDAAAGALFQELEIPASAFYELVGTQRRLNAQWRAVEERRDDLLALERQRGLRGYLARRLKSSGMMRELAIDLSEFESEAESLETSHREDRTELEAIPGLPFLISEIDDDLQTAFRFPTQRIARLLDLFERRRLSGSQNIVAVASAVLAAVIGATSALWVSGHQGSGAATMTITRPTPSATLPSTTGTRTGATSTVATTPRPTSSGP